MAFKWKLCLLITIISSQFTKSFIIPNKTDCTQGDNSSLTPSKANWTWSEKFLKSLSKYRNFFAGLLQEESGEFAYELEEMFNTICNVMSETDRSKQGEQLKMIKWLMDNNKKLNEHLLKNGIGKIEF